MSTGCQNVSQTDRNIYRQADRVTERQNDSMTVWQNSRAAKEPALVVESLKIKDNNVPQNRIFLSKWLKSNDF